jgi:putative ABC transport system permease protein
MSVDPGFKPDGVLTMRISLPPARYSSPERIRTFYLELERRLRELPGVQTVGAISGLPLTGQGGSGTTTVDTQAVPFDRSFPEADSRAVTPHYLQAMGVQLLKGRYFDDRDNETSAPVAIIDETMANAYWPAGDALGRRIKRGGPQAPTPWMTVVGVVRHVRYASLERPSRVQYVYPLAQLPVSSMSVAIRAGSDRSGLASTAQRIVTDLDADLPVYAVRTMDDVMSVSVMRRRLVMLLLTVLAGLAVALAAVGIYGVISYWVAERTQEIGIRVALGASEVRILRMALEQGLAVVSVGVVIGAVGSLILTRTLEGMLFNVSATDPPTFVAVAVGLIGVAVLASYLPARRAARLDPSHSLRQS